MVPSSGALHEFSRAIGALEAGVANLTKIVDEEREDASRHRQALRETIASLAEAVRTLTAQVAALTTKVEDMQEPIEDYKKRRVQGETLVWLIRAGWVAIAGSVGAGAAWLLSGWRHP